MFLFPRFEMASMGGLWLSFAPFPFSFPFSNLPQLNEKEKTFFNRIALLVLYKCLPFHGIWVQSFTSIITSSLAMGVDVGIVRFQLHHYSRSLPWC